MIKNIFFTLLSLFIGYSDAVQAQSEIKFMQESKLRYPAPQVIRMVDAYAKKIEYESAEKMPEEIRFVFLFKGQEVNRKEEADEIIPVVEIRKYALDASRKLTSNDGLVYLAVERLDIENNVIGTTHLKINNSK